MPGKVLRPNNLLFFVSMEKVGGEKGGELWAVVRVCKRQRRFPRFPWPTARGKRGR